MSREPKYDDGGRLQDLVAAADDSVKAALSAGKGISEFLSTIDKLSEDEMEVIVDQAIKLLESFYVHLPMKRAMHAVDPLQRLKLLRRRISGITSELAFHHEMTDIFTSLRDLHTNYILPLHFARIVAFLPFRVKACVEHGRRTYIVSHTMNGFSHPTFVRGVEIQHWNGVPIERAVDIAASYHAGSNFEARHARGVEGLTKRAMNIAPPPDEEWVTVGYKGLGGESLETRIDWTISDLPDEIRAGMPEMSIEAAAAFGLDLEGDTFQRVDKMLFAQQIVAAKRNIESAQAAIAASGGTLQSTGAITGTDSTMPDVFSARVVEVDGRKYSYVRISTFNVSADDPFLNEFRRLIELPEMPDDGLVIDVRGNGGGLIWAGERLLQLLTPRTVEPTRFQFIYTSNCLNLCEGAKAFKDWAPSLRRALETGAAFSSAFPITAPERCNDIGQRYYGPVVLLTDARCYSTTDIFTAGFRDHQVGTILGVDGNTGAGGANVWTLDIVNQFFVNAGLPAPLGVLPKGANLRVAIRRTLRVGPEAGTELEDLGVLPDERHDVTRNDVLNDNVDLIAHAGRLLAGKRAYKFQATQKWEGGKIQLDLATRGVDYVDVFINGRPQASLDVVDDSVRKRLPAPSGANIELRGYASGKLVCSRRLTAQP
ncbi:S41 family peptidase [Methylobacterium planeticum]|uniref:Peptidase S41 n=1 Tax=Methylobacterium planeticum TaxID=2615211 RepID=A0A6N6MD42_9HYPH|nr:S41 family peptidase [Methylobacterium planeticum]KAB1068575.1 peptidase S41 [Methylobacterium planeticum]